jgi:RNA polymerase sigma factor (sigma-70 family)
MMSPFAPGFHAFPLIMDCQPSLAKTCLSDKNPGVSFPGLGHKGDYLRALSALQFYGVPISLGIFLRGFEKREQNPPFRSPIRRAPEQGMTSVSPSPRQAMSAPQFLKAFPLDLPDRLAGLHRQIGDDTLLELKDRFVEYGEATHRGETPDRAEIEAFRDRLSTRLMDSYRASQSQEAFSLLYELNYRLFTNVITARLRRFYFQLDVQDVLQEVFFNIYRYPHKFHADKDQAFRHWASMIIRNTVYKSTKNKDREISREMQDEEIETRPDVGRETPLVQAIHEESRHSCAGALTLMLQIYHAAYLELSSRERKALHMVEIEGEPYKVAAAALGIRLENLKMVVFRARKKILRTLERTMNRALTGPLSDDQLHLQPEQGRTDVGEVAGRAGDRMGRATASRPRSTRIPHAGARESSRFAQPASLRDAHLPVSKESSAEADSSSNVSQ